MTCQRSVLIVEDDADSRELLAELLDLHGHRLLLAANGAEALDLLRTYGESICVILLDLMMPVMNGWEFREAQLKDERWRRVPTIVLTADVRAREKAAELAATDHLTKPVDFNRLLDLVGQHCA